MLKISHENTIYFLRYAHMIYVKKFVYKHSDTIEYVSLLLKKFKNLTGK